MREYRPLTAEQFARAEQRLRNPKPGSKIEAAKEFGIDLTLLIGRLRLTPAERAQQFEQIANKLEPLRGARRRK